AAAKKSNAKSLAQQGRSGADPATFPGKPGGNRLSGGKTFPKMVSQGTSSPGQVIKTQIGRQAVPGNYKRGAAGNHDPGTPMNPSKAISNAKSCAANNRSGGAKWDSGSKGGKSK
ncbi:MAG TPA: hypothetical protein VEP90_18745, partial [Methylomirabilota bacterium]|nr:hypothetical protein [Methylomirabilota bacterium]